MTEILTNYWFLILGMAAITSVAAAVAQAWQKVRRAQAESALKQAMVERGLSVQDIERLLRPAEVSLSEEAAYEALGQSLAEVEPAAMEEIMSSFRAADLADKRAIVHTLKGIMKSGTDPTEADLLALVRGLRLAPRASQDRALEGITERALR